LSSKHFAKGCFLLTPSDVKVSAKHVHKQERT